MIASRSQRQKQHQQQQTVHYVIKHSGAVVFPLPLAELAAPAMRFFKQLSVLNGLRILPIKKNEQPNGISLQPPMGTGPIAGDDPYGSSSTSGQNSAKPSNSETRYGTPSWVPS